MDTSPMNTLARGLDGPRLIDSVPAGSTKHEIKSTLSGKIKNAQTQNHVRVLTLRVLVHEVSLYLAHKKGAPPKDPTVGLTSPTLVVEGGTPPYEHGKAYSYCRVLHGCTFV